MIELKRPQDLMITVVDNEIIRNYMMRIERGDRIDPIRIRGERIIDGCHRAAAYKKLGLGIPTIPA